MKVSSSWGVLRRAAGIHQDCHCTAQIITYHQPLRDRTRSASPRSSAGANCKASGTTMESSDRGRFRKTVTVFRMYFARHGRRQHKVTNPSRRLAMSTDRMLQNSSGVTDLATKLYCSLHESAVGPRGKLQAASLWRGCLTHCARLRFSSGLSSCLAFDGRLSRTLDFRCRRLNSLPVAHSASMIC